MSQVTAAQLRIAMVFMTYPVASETFAQRDVAALQRLGQAVDIYQLNPQVSLLARLKTIPSTLAELLTFPAPGNLLALFWRLCVSRDWRPADRLKCLVLLPAAARAAKRIIATQPDVLHVFWGHYPALVTLLVKQQLPSSRISMFLGAYDLEMKLPVSRWAFALSDQLFTHARTNVADIRAFLGEDAQPQVIHRGIDLQPYPLDAHTRFAVRPVQIFTAGRLIADKGFDRVLRAFAAVRQANPAARLAIAGDGPQRNFLQQLSRSLGVDDAVTFLGWLNEQQVRDQLFRSRVFVLLSTKVGERLPNAVKEGMAAGCVCVSSASPGIDELLEPDRCGYIVAADDEPAVIAAVLAGLRDEAAPLGAAAVAKVRSGFDVDVSARRYMQCWQAKEIASHE